MEQITSRDGTAIGFDRGGSGPPLVLVHGTSADHRRWARVRPALEQHFTVCAVDRRGRGMSADGAAGRQSGGPAAYAIQREAEDIAAVIEEASRPAGQPVSVLAHSYGAICSLEAARLTGKIDRLILYEPPIPAGAPVRAPDLPERMQALIDSGRLEAALELFFREEVRMPEHELAGFRQLPMWQERIRFTPTIPRELAGARAYRFSAERFAGIQTPTLLLLGGDSPPLFRQAVELLAAALPASRTAVLPGQQHVAMDTAPGLFMDEVLGFLDGSR